MEARPPLNDDPIRINLPVTKAVARSERSSEENEEGIRQRKSSKRSKSSEKQTEDGNPFVKPALPNGARRNYGIFSRVPSESSIPPTTTTERGIQISQTSQRPRSANNSFASSHHSSIFDAVQAPSTDTLTALTQETVPDLGDSVASNLLQEPDTQSSENYGCSFDPPTFDLDQIVQADIDDTAIDIIETETVKTEADDELLPLEPPPSLEEKRLRDRLENVFRKFVLCGLLAIVNFTLIL
jgi:hypothetical protein